MARKFADDEHVRRHVRGGVQGLHATVDQALSYLEDGNLERAVDAFDDAEAKAAALSRVVLDWETGANHAEGKKG